MTVGEDLTAFAVSFAVVWAGLGIYALRLWRLRREASRLERALHRKTI